ncbi:MAG: CHASE domain-containing protein [Candidatus Binatia bacterium]
MIARHGLAVLAVAVAYYCAGRLGLLLAIPPGYATAIWPSAGIALAAVLHWGGRIWPGILLGSLAINVGTLGEGTSVAAFARSACLAASIGVGATLEALVGAWLVRRVVGFPTLLIRELDIVAFLGLGGPVACLIGATWAIATLHLGGILDASTAPFSWWTWWVGDTVGVMVVAPLLTVWGTRADQPRRRPLAVIVPLMLTFATAITLFVYASRWEHSRLQADFNRRTELVAHEVQKKVEAAREMLHSIQGLFESSDEVTRSEFRVFATRLLALDVSIQALSWIRRLDDPARPTFEAQLRRDGFAPHGMQQLDPATGLVPAGTRSEYFAVEFIEPQTKGNQPVVGFDAVSDPIRRVAFERARDTGAVAATAPIRLVQVLEEKSLVGVLLVAPIYRHGVARHGDAQPADASDDTARYSPDERRRGLVGFASGSFRIEDMLLTALGSGAAGDVWVRLSDHHGAADESTLYDDRPTNGRVAAATAPDRVLTLDIAGRQWSLEFWPTPAYRAAHRSWEAWTVLATGLLFTATLGALLLVVTGRTAVVEGVVVQRTGELETANEHLRTSEARTRLVLETVYDAFIAIDEAGRITEWNRQAELTFGWSRAKAVGRDVAETIVPSGLRYAHRDGLRRFLATGESQVLGRRIELTAAHADGHEFPVEITITPVRIGDVYSFNAFVHDITQRTDAARELEIAKNAAEAASHAKSEFLASMSHELRTPMNSIIGFTHLLLRSLQTKASDEDLDALQTVRRNAKHLLTLINQILDLERVEAGKVELERGSFDLAALVRDIAEESRPLIGSKPITLAVAADEALVVDADPTRVRQIVTNLLGNALKYTEHGGVEIATDSAADPELGAVARVCVRDTGPGITADEAAQLFERFARLDTPATRRESGTGLGLNLARNFAEMHGGRIDLASDGRSGSEFTLVLPIAAVAARVRTPDASHAS